MRSTDRCKLTKNGSGFALGQRKASVAYIYGRVQCERGFFRKQIAVPSPDRSASCFEVEFITPTRFMIMHHFDIALLVLLCLATSGEMVRGEEIARLKPRDPRPVLPNELQESIEAGVEHLLSTQRKDGAWGGPQWTGGVDNDPVPGAFRSFDVAVAAMCLESLIDVPQSDEVQVARDRAYDFLMARTNEIKRAGPNDLPQVWAHCYCIQTFAKLLARTDDTRPDEQLREAIYQHINGLTRWQSVHGGWFYYGAGMSVPINPSCSFVNSAVLTALARARDKGIDTDCPMVDRALTATRLMRKPDSSFIYTLRIPADKSRAMQPINRPAGSLGRSQVGNLALRLWRDERISDDVIRNWLNRLVTRHGWLDMGRKRPIPHESHAAVAGYFYYFGMYYGTQCIEQLPESEREFYQHHLARLLIDRQEKDGSWFDYPLYSYHKPYGTAFALLSLQSCRPTP